MQGDYHYPYLPLLPCVTSGSKNPLAPSLGRINHDWGYKSGFGQPQGAPTVDLSLANFDPTELNFVMIATTVNFTEGSGGPDDTSLRRQELDRVLAYMFGKSQIWTGQWNLLSHRLSESELHNIQTFFEGARRASCDVELLRPLLGIAFAVKEDDPWQAAAVQREWGGLTNLPAPQVSAVAGSGPLKVFLLSCTSSVPQERKFKVSPMA